MDSGWMKGLLSSSHSGGKGGGGGPGEGGVLASGLEERGGNLPHAEGPCNDGLLDVAHHDNRSIYPSSAGIEPPCGTDTW